LTWVKVPRASLADVPPDHEPVSAWLVFTIADRRYWWSRWVSPELAHVYTVVRADVAWIALDHRLDYLETRLLGLSTEPLAELLPPGWTLAVEVGGYRRQFRQRVPWVIAPWTCVELAKHVLGVRGWGPFTPEGLLRHLEHAGRVRSRMRRT
jgi:hypothetical protein